MAINREFYIEADELDYDGEYVYRDAEVTINTISDVVRISQGDNYIRLSSVQARKLREILERIN